MAAALLERAPEFRHVANNNPTNLTDPLGLRPGDDTLEVDEAFQQCAVAAPFVAADGPIPAADVVVGGYCAYRLGPVAISGILGVLSVIFGGRDNGTGQIMGPTPDSPPTGTTTTTTAVAPGVDIDEREIAQSTFRRRLGGKRGDGCAAHHIVPRTHRLAIRAQRVLRDHGIGLSDVRNGALISAKGHAGVHTHSEIRRVDSRVFAVRSSKQAVLAALALFKVEYENRFPCGA